MAKQKKHNGYYLKTFMYDGKRYYVYGKDQKELAEKVSAKRKELEEGKQNQENPSLNSYYKQFTEMRKNSKSGATLRAQMSQFKTISDVDMESGIKFGEIRIKDVRRIDIESARQILLEGGKTPENLNICFAHLNTVFEHAVTHELLNRNPCKGLERLKRKNDVIGKNRHRALSEAETKAFFEQAEKDNSFYLNAFKLMLLTGIRIGEVAALFLIDLDQDYIHVRRTITRDENGTYCVGVETKTDCSKRDIPLTDEVKAVVREQRKLNNMLFGLGWNGTLFKSSTGELLREYTANREIKRICKRAGIQYFTCHCFRATFATRFIEQRPEDYKILSEILGHKRVAMTLDVYAKVMTARKVESMKSISIKIS